MTTSEASLLPSRHWHYWATVSNGSRRRQQLHHSIIYAAAYMLLDSFKLAVGQRCLSQTSLGTELESDWMTVQMFPHRAQRWQIILIMSVTDGHLRDDLEASAEYFHCFKDPAEFAQKHAMIL